MKKYKKRRALQNDTTYCDKQGLNNKRHKRKHLAHVNTPIRINSAIKNKSNGSKQQNRRNRRFGKSVGHPNNSTDSEKNGSERNSRNRVFRRNRQYVSTEKSFDHMSRKYTTNESETF